MPQAQVADDDAALFDDGLAGRAHGTPRLQQAGDDAPAGAVAVRARLVRHGCGSVGTEPDLCILLDGCVLTRREGGEEEGLGKG